MTKLKAGKYTFVINDKASIHNYGLDGPNGFAKDFTSVSFKGTKTFTLTLKARQVQVLLRGAREHHVRQLHGLLAPPGDGRAPSRGRPRC